MTLHTILALASLALLPLVGGAAQPSAPAHPEASLQSRTNPLPTVEGAWVRAAVPGQQGTGAFMRLTAHQPMRLIGVATPVAGTAEVHEMKLEGEIMRMRQVGQLDLPAGRPVEFKPGGYHLMLMDLKQPLKPGMQVPLTLLLRDAGGSEHRLQLNATVATHAPGNASEAAGPQPGRKH